MAPRSSIIKLPDDLRAELNAKLVSSGFSDYDQMFAWLNDELAQRDMELRISRSAIHRHGQQFEDKLEKMRIATEHARAISEGSKDDEGTMNDALIRLVQTQTFDVLLALEDKEDGEEGEPISPTALSKIGVMVARLANASVKQKEWMVEVREKLEASKQAVADKVDQLTRGKGGLPKKVANQIRKEILGIKTHG